MKIAIVNDHFSSGPGGQHRIQNIANGFSKLGHEVLYLSPYKISNNISDLDLSNAHVCNFSGPSKYLYPYFNDFFGIFKKLVKTEGKLDLIVISLPNTMSKSLNAFFGLAKKIPTAFDFGGLWTSFFDKGTAYGSQSTQLKLFRPISQFYEDSLTLLSSRLPDVITVPTSGMDCLFETFSRRQAYVVYQPVDTSRAFNPSLIKSNAVLENIPIEFMSSRFIAIGVKGDEWFVPILENLVLRFKKNDFIFLVIGSFPKAEYACKKKGLSDKVFFTGNIPYSILPSYIALTEFSIALTHPDLASIWYAPHNIAKIADYMAMGKPVVTDALAATDYIENGVTGFIVGNIEGLLNRTANLVDDRALLLKMSEAARKTACKKFDSTKVAKCYLELFLKNSKKNRQ